MITERNLYYNSQFLIYSYLLTAIFFYSASFFPEARLWGLNSFGYLPWYGPLIYLSVCLSAILPVLLIRGSLKDRYSDYDGDQGESNLYFSITAIAFITFSGILFYLFKVETHYLGDGYQLISWIYEGIHYKPWEKGSFYLEYNFYQLLGDFSKEGARFSLQLFSIICGIIFLTVSTLLAHSLFTELKQRLLFLLGVGSGGYMMLFFGYIESYPPFVLSVLIFIYIGIQITNKRINKWFILLPLLLCGLLHIFTVSLLPAAIYLLISKSRVENIISRMSTRRRIILAVVSLTILITIFIVSYNTSYFFRFTIVPFINDRFTVAEYTMFSAKHILDIINLLFILVPAFLILIPLVIMAIRNGIFLALDFRFLALISLSTLGVGCIFNPGLGMPRDWDLFSFLGVPITILLFYLILDKREKFKGKGSIALLAITLGFLSLSGRVAVQTDKDRAIQLLDNLANLDKLRCRNALFFLNKQLKQEGDMTAYRKRKASNNLSYPHEDWILKGLQLAKQGREREAMQLFKRTVEYDPASSNGWGNLAVSYITFNMLDSAKFCLEITSALNPFSSGVRSNQGWIAFIEGDYAYAESKLREAIALKNSNYTANFRLLSLFEKQSRQREYDSLLWKASDRSDAPNNIIYIAAVRADSLGDRKKAAYYYKRVMESGIDSSLKSEILKSYPELKQDNDF